MREQLGESQEAFAARLGLTRSYYNELEGGKKEPGTTIEKMLDLLEQVTSARQSIFAEPGVVREEPAALTAGAEATRRQCEALFQAALEMAGRLRGGMDVVYSDIVALRAKLQQLEQAHEATRRFNELLEEAHRLVPIRKPVGTEHKNAG